MEEKVIAQANFKGLLHPLGMVVGLAAAVVVFILGATPVKKADMAGSWLTFVVLGIALVIGFVVAKTITGSILKNRSLIVTDQRVKGTLGKQRVEIPIQQVSGVGTRRFNSITIGSSSGRISFSFVDNKEEVTNAISRLINSPKAQTDQVVQQAVSGSIADELKKYKDLLDTGAISEEEYQTKKKELLG